MSVMPICTVDKNRLGALARSRAAWALRSPFLAAVSSLDLRDETKAISDIEKIPFNIVSNRIMSSSTKDLN